jgi:kumamolisin
MTQLTVRSSAAMGPLEVTVYPPTGDPSEFVLSSSNTAKSIAAASGRYAIVARRPNGSRLRQSVSISDKDATVELSEEVPATTNEFMTPEVLRGQVVPEEPQEPQEPQTPRRAALAGAAGYTLDAALVRAAGAALGRPVSLFDLLDEGQPRKLTDFALAVDVLQKERGKQRLALCLWRLEGGVWKEIDGSAARQSVKRTYLSEDFLKVSLNTDGMLASVGLIDAKGFGPILCVPPFADGVGVTFVAKGLLVRAADRTRTPGGRRVPVALVTPEHASPADLLSALAAPETPPATAIWEQSVSHWLPDPAVHADAAIDLLLNKFLRPAEALLAAHYLLRFMPERLPVPWADNLVRAMPLAADGPVIAIWAHLMNRPAHLSDAEIDKAIDTNAALALDRPATLFARTRMLLSDALRLTSDRITAESKMRQAKFQRFGADAGGLECFWGCGPDRPGANKAPDGRVLEIDLVDGAFETKPSGSRLTISPRQMARHPLKGSERKPVEGATSVGKADPDERLEVTVLLRRRGATAFAYHVSKLASRQGWGRHLSRQEFEEQFGADAADIASVKNFAAEHGLSVAQEHAGRRAVVLSGTVAQFNAAFYVDLQQFEHRGGSYRGRVGAVHLPVELHGLVEAVLGLDNRSVAKPRFRARRNSGKVVWQAGAPTATSFTPMQIASLYDFPAGTGEGECVGIIELGGSIRTADLDAYFSALGIASVPKVTVVSLSHGGDHSTGDLNGIDGEVMIEVVGAIAPAARIAVYVASNTDAGFLDAIATAIHDETNKPSVIAISWGGPESSWTQQSMMAFDSAFQTAAAMGITVCVASGDNSSSDGVNDGVDHVDFPASSPHVLACGGTSLRANGTITNETVWNDEPQGGTGGGISSFFSLPSWQSGLPITMRGVPDVSGAADPETGYDVRIDGIDTVIGGTGAAAQLWAGLIARINAARGAPVGFVNPSLYTAGASATRDITVGNNGAYAARAGWDACTGLGTPHGTKIAALFPVSAV